MFKHILLTFDGSQLAEEVLPTAIKAAEQFQAELTLMRVVIPLAKSYRGGSAMVMAIETAENQLIDDAREYLENIASDIRKKGIQVHTVIKLGTPYREIVDYAETNEPDLLIMSTRGETGLTRWMLGSVTSNVIRGIGIPVLVIPADGITKELS